MDTCRTGVSPLGKLAVVALAALIAASSAATAQDWGAMSYSCYHYLTGEPVSCDDEGGSAPVEETFTPQVTNEAPARQPQTVPPPRQTQPAVDRAANLRAKRESRKIGLWIAANDLFYGANYRDALRKYEEALALCNRWSLSDCDALQWNIDAAGRKLAELARLEQGRAAFGDAIEALRSGDRKSAQRLFRQSVSYCRQGGYTCKSAEQNTLVLAAADLVKTAAGIYDSNPGLAFAYADVAEGIYFDLYLACDDPETPRCQFLLKLWSSAKGFVETEKIELTDRFEAESKTRLNGVRLPRPAGSDYALFDEGGARRARLYLELMQLPDDKDLGLLFNTGPDIDTLPKHRDFDLLERPLALYADRLIGDLKSLFETDWFGSGAETSLWDERATGNSDVMAAIRGDNAPRREAELRPLESLNSIGIDEIESDARIYSDALRTAGANPRKVDYMLAGLHYANVLEGTYKGLGVGLTADQKWEVSDLYLRAMQLQDTANPAIPDAIAELGRIKLLAGMQ